MGKPENIAIYHSNEITVRSEELREEYESLKAAQEIAAEKSTFTFNKRRGIAAEIKQYKEQMEEAVRFEQLQEEKVCE